MDASDAELVRRVRAGDTAAYGVLVTRYRDRLGRYAVHMLGDREDAEEALQDAFVRAYRSLARCNDPQRFGAWLYGILVNRCRTTGARAARRRRVFVRDEATLNGTALPGPPADDGWGDAVHRALARL
ncbi:MAG: RNA polymerase sigma factor, partial [Gemmatimonadales bacterium]